MQSLVSCDTGGPTPNIVTSFGKDLRAFAMSLEEVSAKAQPKTLKILAFSSIKPVLVSAYVLLL